MKPTRNDTPNRGTRERKHEETRRRIAEAGLRLFLMHGYAETTVDAIAEEAGISRRTFFAYFKTKDELILAWQMAEWDAIWATLLTVSPDETPLDAVRSKLMAHAAQYQSEQMVAIDQVIRSSETLTSRKLATYALQEEALYDVLRQVWRQPQRQAALRAVAMLSIGAMRLAIEAWGKQPNQRSPAEHLQEAFDTIEQEFSSR